MYRPANLYAFCVAGCLLTSKYTGTICHSKLSKKLVTPFNLHYQKGCSRVLEANAKKLYTLWWTLIS